MTGLRYLRMMALVLFFFSAAMGLAGENVRPPNIIFIMADDLGYGELGCYGQKLIKTPHIDQLAAEGMKFTQFYAGNAVCAPSRCVLMTGKHPGHAVVRNNTSMKIKPTDPPRHWPGQYPLPDDETTIAEVLKSQGYATAAIGKWGLGYVGNSGDPQLQGFDLFYGYLCQEHAHNHYPKFLWNNGKREIQPGNNRTATGKIHSQDQFTRMALQFIRENRDRPFFLYLPIALPHVSIQVPEEILDEYRGKIPETEYKHGGYQKHPTPRAGYAAMVTYMDRDVGRIMSLLKELGLDENTLVIFTSDNGPTHGRVGGADSEFFHSAGPLRGLKGSLHEGGIREPTIARWPGKIAPGTVSNYIGAFWDVLPTLADVAGAEKAVPKDIDGVSFLPTLLGQTDRQVQHPALYWEFGGYGGQQAVRMGRWKAIRRNIRTWKKPGCPPIELYDLDADLAEKNNVAKQHPEIVEQIKKIMADEHATSKAKVFRMKAIDP